MNPLQRNRRLKLWLGVAAIAIMVAAAWPLILRYAATEYRTFYSPGGRYTLTVYRYPVFISVMPGQSGDASGLMVLRNKLGKTLYKEEVPMVSIVENITWNPESVVVRGIATWSLTAPPR